MESPDDMDDRPIKRRPPATTPEGRENQMISLAFDQAELLLREGRAPAPVLVHYLKLATEQSALEKERIKSQIMLDQKKADNIETSERLEKVYEEARKAMLQYQGRPEDSEPEEIDFYD